MKTRIMLLLTALFLLTCACAEVTLPADLTVIEASAFENADLSGVLTLPATVEEIGARAFAGTALHGLVVPEGCTAVDASALADTGAAYLLLRGSSTTLSGQPTGVTFLFAPADSAAAAYSGFYALETLTTDGGLYYSVTAAAALPLCAADAGLSGSVTIPKLLNGVPVTTLEQLLLTGMDGVAELRIPAYLTAPEGVTAAAYETMTVSAPVTTAEAPAAGDEITWTTTIEGAYGDVAYIWTFDLDGTVYSTITAVPEVTYALPDGGACTVTVTAEDALGDRATAVGEAVTIAAAKPVYRALLVGNTYPGTVNELPGCDTDVNSMKIVLSSMDTTNYQINAQYNLSAVEIQNAITSTFYGAKETDVSLFFFSGHGTSSGKLVGTSGYVSPALLRSVMDTIPGKKIILLDCCYSGNFISKGESVSPADFNSAIISAFSWSSKGDSDLASNGYYVITACTMTELSNSLSTADISFGAFTYGICYGSGYDILAGSSLSSLPADTNGDRAITIPEAVVVVDEWIDTFSEWVGQDLGQSVQTYYDDSSFVLWQD